MAGSAARTARRRAEWGRLAFTAVYTALVLPFTVAFFGSFVRPPEGLGQLAFAVALPLFLAALEYAGVSLATRFWRERKPELLALFLACQALAVGSAYYDARAREWDDMKEVRRNASLSATAARKEDDARNSDVRRPLEARLREARLSTAETRRQIAQLTLAPSARVRTGDDSAWLLENDRLRQKGEALASLRSALRESTRQEKEIADRVAKTYGDATQADRSPAALPETAAPTALAYAIETVATPNSVVAVFLSCLFPVTILALARLTVPAVEEPTISASTDLRRELEECAALPEARHDAYAALMEPVLAAHLASLRAVRLSAARGLALAVETDAEIDVLESAAGLKDQIEASGLAPSAKQRLSSYVDRLMTEGLEPAPSAA